MINLTDILRCDDLAYSNSRTHDVMYKVDRGLDDVLLVSTVEDHEYEGDFVPSTQVLCESETDGDDVFYTYTPLMLGPVRASRDLAAELRAFADAVLADGEEDDSNEDHCLSGCALCLEVG